MIIEVRFIPGRSLAPGSYNFSDETSTRSCSYVYVIKTHLFAVPLIFLRVLRDNIRYHSYIATVYTQRYYDL